MSPKAVVSIGLFQEATKAVGVLVNAAADLRLLAGANRSKLAVQILNVNADRFEDIAAALSRELDRLYPSPTFIRRLIGAAAAAATALSLAVAGGAVGGVAESWTAQAIERTQAAESVAETCSQLDTAPDFEGQPLLVLRPVGQVFPFRDESQEIAIHLKEIGLRVLLYVLVGEQAVDYEIRSAVLNGVSVDLGPPLTETIPSAGLRRHERDARSVRRSASGARPGRRGQWFAIPGRR